MIKDEFDKQFGNIEYLSDSELKEQNRRAKIASSNLGTSLSEETKNKIKKTYATDEMRAVQASKSKPHTEETKEKIREAFTGKERPPEVIEKIKQKRTGKAVYHKPFVTPSGAFPSKKASIEWALEHGVRNPSGKFDKWIKERSDEFY